jgi:VanZ family protein
MISYSMESRYTGITMIGSSTGGKPMQLTVVQPYIFDERGGSIVHNRGGSAGDLYIPNKYEVIHPTLFDPISQAFSWSKGFWKDAIINLMGFIPLGSFLCAWFCSRGSGRPLLLATVAGGLVSLFIEIVQTRLPTRDSSMSDVLNNLAGSFCGAILYFKAQRRLSIFESVLGRAILTGTEARHLPNPDY